MPTILCQSTDDLSVRSDNASPRAGRPTLATAFNVSASGSECGAGDQIPLGLPAASRMPALSSPASVQRPHQQDINNAQNPTQPDGTGTHYRRRVPPLDARQPPMPPQPARASSRASSNASVRTRSSGATAAPKSIAARAAKPITDVRSAVADNDGSPTGPATAVHNHDANANADGRSARRAHISPAAFSGGDRTKGAAATTGAASGPRGWLRRWLDTLLDGDSAADALHDTVGALVGSDGSWGAKASSLLSSAHAAVAGSISCEHPDDDGGLSFTAFCEVACTHLVATLLQEAREEAQVRRCPSMAYRASPTLAARAHIRRTRSSRLPNTQASPPLGAPGRQLSLTPALWRARQSLNSAGPAPRIQSSLPAMPEPVDSPVDHTDALPDVAFPALGSSSGDASPDARASSPLSVGSDSDSDGELIPSSAMPLAVPDAQQAPLIDLEVASEDGDEEDGLKNGGKTATASVPFLGYDVLATPGLEVHRDEARMTLEATFIDDCDDGTAELNQYVLLEPLGKGSQGEVHLAMDTEKNELRAIKAVPRPAARTAAVGRPLNAARRRQVEQLEREVAIMKKCRHRNVVALYEVIDDPEQDKMYLVMQYVEHGPIASVLENGSVSQTIQPARLALYARQLVSGLDYLHKRGIIHRDIKPENILLGTDDQVFLADFGTAETFESGARLRVEGTRGTLAFVAPELLAMGRSRPVVVSPAALRASPGLLGSPGAYDTRTIVDGEAVDVWALGVTLYALLYGELPFFADAPPALFQSITTYEPEYFNVSTAYGSQTTLATNGPASMTEGSPFQHRPGAGGDNLNATMAMTDSESRSTIHGLSPSRSRVDHPTTIAERWEVLLRGMLEKNPRKRMPLAKVKTELTAMSRTFSTSSVVSDGPVFSTITR